MTTDRMKEILQSSGCLYPDAMFAPQGWVCPKCGRVYSPTTPMCFYCGENVAKYTTTTDPSHPFADDVMMKGDKDA